MANAPTPEAGIEEQAAPPGRIWTGTGLCCEAQGDGVPCGGTAGECEACGKAIPLPKSLDLGDLKGI